MSRQPDIMGDKDLIIFVFMFKMGRQPDIMGDKNLIRNMVPFFDM